MKKGDGRKDGGSDEEERKESDGKERERMSDESR